MEPSVTSRICQAIAVAFALLTMYVGLLGPAVWLYDRSTPSVQRVFEVAYLPLLGVTGGTPVGDLLETYADLFR